MDEMSYRKDDRREAQRLHFEIKLAIRYGNAERLAAAYAALDSWINGQ